MATKNLFTEDDINSFMSIPSEEETFSDDDILSVTQPERANPAQDVEQNLDKAAVNAEAAAQDESDFVANASKAVKPKYLNAISKVDGLFNSDAIKEITGPGKLSSKSKAAFIGVPENTVGLDDKSVDRLVFKKRVSDAAVMYPDYVSKADVKSLEQLYSNPEAVKKLTNSAQARAKGFTTFEKFLATNKAAAMQMANTLEYLIPSPSSDFDKWALNYQILDAERRATSVRTEGSAKLDKMWASWKPFDDKSKVSFSELLTFIGTSKEGFAAAFAEASNSAASIASSIAGGAAGAVAGLPGGVPGIAVGAFIGRAAGGAVPAFDEYVQNELEVYRDKSGNINWKAVKKDIEPLITKWRVEAAEQGLIAGAAEAFAPKVLKGLGGVFGKALATPAVEKVVAKTFNNATTKALAKSGKFGAKIAAKGAEEFVGEGAGAFLPKTAIDFQNGRLSKNRAWENFAEAAREGVAGAITGAALGPVSAATEAAVNTIATKRSSKFTEKPINEFTKEDAIDATFEVKESEEVIQRLDGLDEDSETVASMEGLSDIEKISMLDSANTENIETEDGIIIQGATTEAIVNGADLETLLGEDVNTVKALLTEERQSALAEAISTGEDFRFTYGEWVVALSKLKEKHPTAYLLTIDNETNMPGYEAGENLSEVLDVLQSQYDSLILPAQGSLPPPSPGISAEVSQELNAEIKPKKQTNVVTKVSPTNNVNEVILTLADGSVHEISLYNKESPLEIQAISDKLTKQFAKALRASGNTSELVVQASLEGIPVIMRVLLQRANALGKPISEFADSITFRSDQSHGSAYISVSRLNPSKVSYGVGRAQQRVSTVIHEFAHAILTFMIVDAPELEAQSQAGTLNEEGMRYLDVIKNTAKLLGVKDISEVESFQVTPLTNPKTGEIKVTNQSRRPLTKYTVLHEKLATTMEVFLKTGELETDSMEAAVSSILLYWRSLIPEEITSRLASVSEREGWQFSGEYHQAIDPSEEVSKVFHSMYAVNQEIETQAVPLFNISFFPVEILGKQGQTIIDKVVAAKHLAIAKVFAKMYSDSINARNEINTPEVISTMNTNLFTFFSETNAGLIIQSLNDLGLRMPEVLGPDLKAIQDFMNKYSEAKAEYTRDADITDIETLIQNYPDAFEDGESADATLANFVNTFNEAKEDVYERTLEELGYVNDTKVKEAAESMLAKALPGILNEQFTQLVAAYPEEAKALFSAYIKNGKVSSRVAHKQIAEAALKKIYAMKAKDLKVKPFIRKVRDGSSEVVSFFNQGRFLEALAAKHNELINSEMLNLAPELVKKVQSSIASIDKIPSLDYQYANAGDVHPEVLAYLRLALTGIAQKDPIDTSTVIENLDWQLNDFVAQQTEELHQDLEGLPLDSVEAVILIGDYTKLMGQVARGAMKLEKDGRKGIETAKVVKTRNQIMKSNKVWSVESKWLPQVNSVHEIFSTYFKSEEAYRESAIFDIINDIENEEASVAIETEEISKRLREFAAKSVAKPLEQTRLQRTGLLVNNRDELLSVILYMGSKSGIETLARTHGLVQVDPNTGTEILMTEDLKKDIEDLIKSGEITDADINFVNAIWAEFVPLFKMIKEVYRRDRGIEVGEVEATEFTLAGETFNGGYFPITSVQLETVGDKNPTLDFYSTFGLKTFRRTKERGKRSRTPVRLGLTSVPTYIGMALREYHIAPKLNLFKAFVNNPEVNAHIQLTRPGALGEDTGVINDWVRAVESQIADRNMGKGSKLVGLIQRNTSLVFFSTDIVSAGMNLTAGIPAAIPYVGSNARLAMNIALMPWKISSGSWRRNAALSKQMISNEKQFIQFVANEHSEDLYTKKTSAKDFIRKAALFTQRASQQVLELLIWNTEYEFQKAKGKSDTESVKHADGVTSRVLGRYAVSNRSLGQKGELNRLMGIATQHLTAFKRQFNIEVNRDSPLGRRVWMTSLIFAGVMASINIAMFIQDKATPDRPNEEEEEKAFNMKAQMVVELISYMLGPFGRVISGGINVGFGSDISITPVEHTIKKTMRGLSKIPVGMMTDYEYDARDWADVFGMLTMMTGIPFSAVSNVNDFALVWADHEEVAAEREWKNTERAAYNEEVSESFQDLIN